MSTRGHACHSGLLGGRAGHSNAIITRAAIASASCLWPTALFICPVNPSGKAQAGWEGGKGLLAAASESSPPTARVGGRGARPGATGEGATNEASHSLHCARRCTLPLHVWMMPLKSRAGSPPGRYVSSGPYDMATGG